MTFWRKNHSFLYRSLSNLQEIPHWNGNKMPKNSRNVHRFISRKLSNHLYMNHHCPTSRFISTRALERIKRFPAEWEEHDRCFVVWPASGSIWGNHVRAVRKDVAAVAQAISKFEKVTALVSPNDVNGAKRFFNSTSNVEILDIPVNDLWARDTFPVFLENGKELVAVDFNFNGWGNKQVHERDCLVASKITEYLGIKGIKVSVVGEGGSFETDGAGTLLITESSIINDNRNKGKTRQEIETTLKETLGMKKIIWFKGVKGKDITDAHVDGFVRFTSPGNVVINRPAAGTKPDIWSRVSDNVLKVLQKETDASGNSFRIVELPEPDRRKISGKGNSFCASYVNYYVANGAVIIPKFNDKEADNRALEMLGNLHPGRKMVQVQIDALGSAGGGIHCATHELPKLSR